MLRPPFSQEPIPINNWDVIVIGAGAAGLMTCLELPANLKVLLLNRNTSNGKALLVTSYVIQTTIIVDGIFVFLAILQPTVSGLV